MKFATKQEEAWAGQFGAEYIERNSSSSFLGSISAFFAKVFQRTGLPASVLELGANVGLNLEAIHGLSPESELHAVEINPLAIQRLKSKPFVTVHEGSLVDFKPDRTYDFVFTRGVLIHLAPEVLPKVYGLMHAASSAHVMVAEYYNTTPVEVQYRGNDGLLFKRDFAGEMMRAYKDLSLVDYGFIYRGDKAFPQDDITWFLMSRA